MAAAAATTERSAPPWWAVLIGGVTMAIVGFLLLLAPGMTTVALMKILGLYWLVNGIVNLARIFIDRSHWGRKLAIGLLGIIAGLMVIEHPLWSGVLLPGALIVSLGVLGIFIGVLEIVEGLGGRGWERWGPWLLGVVSILFGLLLVFNPLPGVVALPFLIGILAIAGGVGATILAFAIRSDRANRDTSPIANAAG
jgi:uncharacterized membrane protein HdeD (DUF308 family)